MPESRFPPIVLLTLLIACLCIYGIILQPTATFAGMDFLNLGYPRILLAKDAWQQGHLPLWNWYEWGGAPLLATHLGALVYPPTWIAMMFPLPYGLQLFVFLHLFMAGLGAFSVARRLMNLGTAAALVCGIIYMGNAFFPGRIEQFQVVAVNSLFPWLALAFASALRGGSGPWLLAIVWCLTLLAGHPQFAAFNFIGASFFTIFPWVLNLKRKGVSPGPPMRPALDALSITAIAIFCGTGLAAVQLLPTWELGNLSERIWPYAQPTQPQLEWKHLPALVVPQYYNMLTGASGRVFGYSELGLYAGLIAVPLALAGAVSGLRNKCERPMIASAITLWLFAVLFALGTNGVIASLVFKYVPFFEQSRGAARSLNLASLMLALLAGRGVMSLMDISTLGSKRRQLSTAAILAAIFIIDQTVNNLSALKSLMVPLQVLSVRPLLPSDKQQQLQKMPHRLYRFMAFDSDLYLNNSPTAVAERMLRLQPNLNSLSRIALVDGYEEGLFPMRTRANLFRRYNRNLRNDAPDAALLAFLGSNLMLTEYPLPASETWTPVSPPLQRPPIVPPVMEPPAYYNFYQSAYDPALVLDLRELITSPDNPAGFLAQTAAAFPAVQKTRIGTNNEWTTHPLEAVSPEAFTKAAAAFPQQSGFHAWNAITATASRPTTQALILLPPYPGWKAVSKNGSRFPLKNLCSLFYLIESHDKDEEFFTVRLNFTPFSFRLGMFVSLLMAFFLFQFVCRTLGHRILAKKKEIGSSTNETA